MAEKETKFSWVVKYRIVPKDTEEKMEDRGKSFDDKEAAELFAEKVKAVARCHTLGIPVDNKEVSAGVDGIMKSLLYVGIYEKTETLYVIEGEPLQGDK